MVKKKFIEMMSINSVLNINLPSNLYAFEFERNYYGNLVKLTPTYMCMWNSNYFDDQT